MFQIEGSTEKMMNFDANSMNLSYAALAALAYNNIYIYYTIRVSRYLLKIIVRNEYSAPKAKDLSLAFGAVFLERTALRK